MTPHNSLIISRTHRTGIDTSQLASDEITNMFHQLFQTMHAMAQRTKIARNHDNVLMRLTAVHFILTDEADLKSQHGEYFRLNNMKNQPIKC